MTRLNYLDSDGLLQDSSANRQHDRKYGWHISSPRVYTNIARNPEYDLACPYALREKAQDEDELREIIWKWHNRKREMPLLSVVEEKNDLILV